MNKIKHLAIISFTLILLSGISSCSINLGYFFKKLAIDQTFGRIDLGKVLLELDTKDYKIMIRENRTTYCPESVTHRNPNLDTVEVKNRRLNEMIDILFSGTKIITRFINLNYNPKIDLTFISRGITDKNANLDTLIYHLERIFCFETKKENIKYDFSFVDSIKYSNLLSNERGFGSIICSKSKMSFFNKDLNSITDLINYNYDIFVDYDKSDKNRYSMVLPVSDLDSLRSYLINKCGIELVSSQMDDKYVKIVFN